MDSKSGTYTNIIIEPNRVIKQYKINDIAIFVREYAFLRLIEKYQRGLKIINLRLGNNHLTTSAPCLAPGKGQNSAIKCPELCLIKFDGDLSSLKHKIIYLPENKKLLLAYDIILNLRNLHNIGIIHRDIKPKNILINLGLIETAICDFNISVLNTGTSRPMSSYVQTPLYRAPEVLRILRGKTGQANVEYGPKIDIWGLGLVLYELFFIKPPYNRDLFERIAMIDNCSTIPALLTYDIRIEREPTLTRLAKLRALPDKYRVKTLANKARQFCAIYSQNTFYAIIEIIAHCLDPNPAKRGSAGQILKQVELLIFASGISRKNAELGNHGPSMISVLASSEATLQPMPLPRDSASQALHWPDLAGFIKGLRGNKYRFAVKIAQDKPFRRFRHFLNGATKDRHVRELAAQICLNYIVNERISPNKYFNSGAGANDMDALFALSLIYISAALLDIDLPNVVSQSWAVRQEAKKIMIECDGYILPNF